MRTAAIVVCAVMAVAALDALAASQFYTVEVRALPGRRFAPLVLSAGVVVLSVDGEATPYVPVADLARAVNGGPGLGPRLVIRGTELHAVEAGACPGCVLRINRAGLLSSGVAPVNRASYVPLQDVAQALGGALGVDQRRGRYVITLLSPACGLCLLRPNR